MHRAFAAARARYILLALVATLVIHIVIAQPVINEVMPNPVNESDEWIEIWNVNNETLNLSEWSVRDNFRTNGIACGANCTINATYFLVLGNQSNISRITNNSPTYFFVNGTEIGNGLSNTADYVRFFNSTYETNMTYNSTTENVTWALINGNWTLCSNPTPGVSNACSIVNDTNVSLQNVALSINLSSVVVVNVTYDGIFNISIYNKTNCSVLDNVTIAYNITSNISTVSDNYTTNIGCYVSAINWTPNETGEYTACGCIANTTANNTDATDDCTCSNVTVVGSVASSCNLSVSISVPDIVDLNNTSSLSYDIILNDSSCNGTSHAVNVTYRIDDLFGNSVRSPYTSSTSMTCNLNLHRSWTPDDIIGSEGYLIKANITASGCNDTNGDNDYAEKLVVVKGSSGGSSSSSYINITSVSQGSDNTSKWGESLDVWLEIYRGDTSKYSVDVYVNGTTQTSSKVSEETIVHANEKYVLYGLKVPVRLKPNCGGDWSDGTYALVVSGFDQIATASISIVGVSSATCKTVTGSCPSSGGGGGGGGGCPCNATGSANTSATANETVYPNFYFIHSSDEVAVGEEFDVVVAIRNNASNSLNSTIYSYVYEGSRLVSEGKGANGTWQKGWDANAQSLFLDSDRNSSITLVNRIKSNATIGMYTLRVRIQDYKDISRQINVVHNDNASNANASSVRPAFGSSFVIQTQNQSQTNQTRARRLITREDPIDAMKRAAGEAAQSLSKTANVLTGLAADKMPDFNALLFPNIAVNMVRAFICGQGG